MNLEEIEARLQSLIEAQLANAIIGRNTENLIAHKIAAVIKENTITNPDGTQLAPNVYTIVVSPTDAEHWQELNLKDTLADIIKTTAQDTE